MVFLAVASFFVFSFLLEKEGKKEKKTTTLMIIQV